MRAVADAPSGSANVVLNKQAFRLGSWAAAGMIPHSDALECLKIAAEQRGIPRREAQDTIKSGFRAGLRKPIEARNGR